jgi:hypothetical protein
LHLFAFIWDGGWWCVSLDVLLEVAAVMGIVFTNASRRRGVWGRKPKTEHKGLVLDCVCANGLLYEYSNPSCSNLKKGGGLG